MSDHTILQYIIPAVVALASSIGILWKHILKQHHKTSERLDRSQTEHKETNEKLIGLTEKVGILEGRQHGVETLAKSVLEEIRNLDCKKSEKRE